MVAIEAHHDILDCAHLAEQLGILECSCDAHSRNRVRCPAVDPFAFKPDCSAVDRVKTGDDVKHRTLASAVWPDDGLDRPSSDIERNFIQRDNSAEADGDILKI